MRLLDFSDGYDSASAPDSGNVAPGALTLPSYASDAAYVTAKGSAAAAGDVYYNTADTAVKAYIAGAWRYVVDRNSTETLQNKKFEDSSTVIADASDPTKQIAFDAGGTTSTKTTIRAQQTGNRTLDTPDENGYLAHFHAKSDSGATIANNQGSPSDVTGLLLDKTSYKSAIVLCEIRRKTTTNEAITVGLLHLYYRALSDDWELIDELGGDPDDGVTLTVTAAGQVQYISDSMSGSSYTGTMKFRVLAIPA